MLVKSGQFNNRETLRWVGTGDTEDDIWHERMLSAFPERRMDLAKIARVSEDVNQIRSDPISWVKYCIGIVGES